jgi:hypothetical protein
MPRPNFEISTDTALLYHDLVRIPPGGEITYTALSESMGREIAGGDPHLQTALRRALTLDGAVFDNIRGVGYRRLKDEEIVAASTRDTDGIRRKSRRAARKLSAVEDYTALPADVRIEHSAKLSLFGALLAMTKPSAIDNLRTQVATAGRELPFAKTLEAFRK